MSMITLYFLTILDNVNGLLFLSLVVLLGISAIYFYMGIEKKEKNLIKKSKIFLSLSIVFILVFTFMPTTKQLAFIYVAGKISQNKDVQQIPEKAMQLINLKFTEYINDAEKSIKQGN